MTNREIGIQFGKLAREERRLENEILKLIILSDERRAYLEHGFTSTFEWMVKGFCYSHSTAFRKVSAARVLKVDPSVEAKLDAGEVNLTTLSKVQTVILAQEKATGHKVSVKDKVRMVEQIVNKSAVEAKQILFSLMPEAASSVKQERQVVIDGDTTRRTMNFTKEMNADLQRMKELLSHKFPEGSDAEVLAHAMKFFLDKTDPLRVAAAASKRVTKVGAKRAILKSSGGACTYKDEDTGTVCGSRFQVQLDHIIPKALGGTDDPTNLRPLCRQHNLLMAERAFGKAHMDRFRRN